MANQQKNKNKLTLSDDQFNFLSPLLKKGVSKEDLERGVDSDSKLIGKWFKEENEEYREELKRMLESKNKEKQNPQYLSQIEIKK